MDVGVCAREHVVIVDNACLEGAYFVLYQQDIVELLFILILYDDAIWCAVGFEVRTWVAFVFLVASFRCQIDY